MTASLFLQHLLVSTLFLTVLGGVVFLLCRLLSLHASRLCRVMWLCVLLSGILWFRVSLSLPVLPVETVAVETQEITARSVSDGVEAAQTFNRGDPVADAPGCYSTPVETITPKVVSTKISVETLLLAIWLGGVLFFFGRGMVGYVRLLRHLTTATPERLPMWESLLAEADIAAEKIPVVFAEDVGSLLVRTPFRCLLVLPEEP